MLAGRIVAKGAIRLVDMEEPRLSKDGGEGTIIFQPEITCLCGSDLPFFAEDQPSYPLPDGLSLHEMVGTVIDTSGERFRPGDKVLAVPVGQVGLFERFELSDERVIPLDARKPPEIAMLSQPLGTVIYALRKLPSLIDLNVVVVGQGPIGQIFNACLRNLGARQIIALDRVPARLEMAPHMGATAAVDVTTEDPVAAVARLTGDRMADLVIEAVGHQNQALNLCIDLCRDEGRIFFFGVTQEEIHGIRWRNLFFKSISVHTSVNPDFRRDFPLAMRWICEDRLDLSPLITHHFELKDIQEAYETFRDKKDGALKVVVEFPANGFGPSERNDDGK